MEVAGDAESVTEPQRRCIVTGGPLPLSQKIRFVIGPDNSVVPDLKGALPGRGIWLSADRISIKTACQRNLFARAARQKVRVTEDLADQIEALLVQRCVELLALARRAGQAVVGYAKVEGWVRSGNASYLLAATDAAENGRRKLSGIASAPPSIDVLRRDELGAAFGRDSVVHGALAAGGLAEKFAETARRLAGFRQATTNEEKNE
ncbi:MAG: RNA-binding protein [Alphaproteobacteria bacterium]|nr:RNA-binding protein [Alphaproteobacteria bacterium]